MFKRPEPAKSSPILRLLTPTIVLALGAGLLLRLFFFFRYAHIAGDTLVYGDIAANLLRHGIYGFTNGPGNPIPIRPTLIRLPGYPLFLMAIFRIFGVGRYTAAIAIQIALDLVSCLLLSQLAARLFGRRAALAALWLAVLCPFTANYTAAPLTEIPVLLTIALTYFSLERWQAAGSLLNRWLSVIGAALAASALLRPDQGLLAAAVAPAILWIAFKRQSALKALQPALIVSLLTILPLIPWAARNWHTFHVLQPLAPRLANDPGERNPDGFQRWYRTWAIDYASTDTVYWNYDGNTIDIATLPNRAFDSNTEYVATETLLDDYNDKTVATPALDDRFAVLAAKRIQADPLRYYVALPVARVLNMCFRPRSDMLPVPLEWWKFSKHPRATIFAIFYAGLNLFYFGLAGWTVARRQLWENHRPLIWSMLAFLIMRLTLLLNLDNSEPRYTLEFLPILIVLGAGFWGSATSRGD